MDINRLFINYLSNAILEEKGSVTSLIVSWGLPIINEFIYSYLKEPEFSFSGIKTRYSESTSKKFSL